MADKTIHKRGTYVPRRGLREHLPLMVALCLLPLRAVNDRTPARRFNSHFQPG